ncbi:ABC transporter substrate-binding protein [Amycolatopsis pigmentata]|uniref:ABC transporter substrate-binding protein n=1 Tax=Amycolatopsis pigmentata TaxID=450801 RepID=A0ABW5FZ34_9PSEU
MHKSMRRSVFAPVAVLALAACSDTSASSGSGLAVAPHTRGGEVTVLEGSSYAGSWPAGLDPATNTNNSANISQYSAIFGGLFTMTAKDDGSDARVVPNQAESYQFLDNSRTVKITIRNGVKFSDGTPLDAEAVAFNFRRDLATPCSCAPKWPLASDGITVQGNSVLLKFNQPYASIIDEFPNTNVNWIASPAALRRLGPDAFKVTPVGAGPFKVFSDKLSSELVLLRNPFYFKEGLPYLDRLDFKAVDGDQSAYQALRAGQAQAYEGLTTVPVLDQAQADPGLTTTVQPPTSPYVVQLNTRTAPFSDQLAREAIYYATDFGAIARGVFTNRYPVSQMFTGPGGLFHHPTVPGYRNFDLARARQIIGQLNGLTIKLGTLNTSLAQQVATALQSQWRAAGMTVDLQASQLNGLVQQYNSGTWQVMLQTAGSWDPAAGSGVSFRFSSTSAYSGVADPHLDDLLYQGKATTDPAQRDALYAQAGRYISEKAYAPFGIAFAPADLAVKGVYGPGLTTKIPPLTIYSGILWDQVYRN